mgnify:CR=1 FL=1
MSGTVAASQLRTAEVEAAQVRADQNLVNSGRCNELLTQCSGIPCGQDKNDKPGHCEKLLTKKVGKNAMLINLSSLNLIIICAD